LLKMLEVIRESEYSPEKYGAAKRLSEKSGIAYSTIRSWFDRESRPNVEEAARIAVAMGVSLDYLITGQEYWAELQNGRVRRLCRRLGALSDHDIETIEMLVDRCFARMNANPERGAEATRA